MVSVEQSGSRPALRNPSRIPLTHRVIGLGCLSLLGACTSYESKPLVPLDELRQLCERSLEGIEVKNARPGPEPLTFDLSDGLDEAELVAVALTLNPELQAKRLLIGESESLLITAGLWPNPDLSGAVRAGISGASSTSVGLDLLFGLLRPGERPAKRALAEATIEVTRSEVAAEELRVAAEVKRARLAVLSAEQAVRQVDREARLREEALRLTERQRELGEGTQLGVALVELDRAAFLRQAREAAASLDAARRALNALLGLPPLYETPITGLGQPLAFSLYKDVSDDELKRRVVDGRFDVRARAAGYAQVEAELRLAVLKQYPSLSIGPSFERDTEGNSSLGLGIALNLPIFDRAQGEIAQKLAARERSRADYVATLHAGLAQAFDARARLRRARAEVELLQREVVPLIQRSDTLFEGAFRARELTVFEWLTARTKVLEVRKSLLDALLRHASAAAELEAATGSSLAAPVSRPSTQETRK